jgi:hypothetical protein
MKASFRGACASAGEPFRFCLTPRGIRGRLAHMAFDAQAIFANLAEQERIKGHHSPEGRAIRTLSRALSGWSAGTLSRRDVIVLCDQAIADWLNARLRRSAWSIDSIASLAPLAIANRLITPAEAERLLELHNLRALEDSSEQASTPQVEGALEFCIELVEKRW